MIHLISGGSLENSDAVVPIRWCLDARTVAKLKAEEAYNPLILFSIWRDGREVGRKCALLEQGMEYIEFSAAGEHIIYAVIVWNQNYHALRDVALNQWGHTRLHRYAEDGSMSFTTRDMGGWWLGERADSRVGRLKDVGRLKVNVAEEFFAHEPSEREKKWVNFWWSSLPKDQCEYRRRRIVAYTVQPVVLTVWTPFIIVVRAIYALILLFFGMRGVVLQAIVHPFYYSTSEVWDAEYHGSLYKYNRKKRNFFSYDSNNNRRPLWFSVLRPMNWTIVAVSLFGISLLPVWLTEMISSFLRDLGVWVGLAAVIILPIVLLWKSFMGAEKRQMIKAERRKKKDQERERLLKEQQEKALAKYDAEMKALVCGTTPMVADISALENPPLTLRYKSLKAKVCRPYIHR